MSREIVRAARRAAKELRTKPLPEDRPLTRKFAEVIGKTLNKKGAIKRLNTPFWQNTLKLLGEDLSCSADIYFFVGGLGKNAAELAVKHSKKIIRKQAANHVPESERVELVLRIFDAIGATAAT